MFIIIITFSDGEREYVIASHQGAGMDINEDGVLVNIGLDDDAPYYLEITEL